MAVLLTCVHALHSELLISLATFGQSPLLICNTRTACHGIIDLRDPIAPARTLWHHLCNDSLTSVCALQCELMIRQGLVRRVFGEWQRLCQERDWKTQLATRDNEIKRMDREVRQAEPLLSQVLCCDTISTVM